MKNAKTEFVEFDVLHKHPKYKKGLLPIIGSIKDMDGRSFAVVDEWILPRKYKWRDIDEE